MEETAKMVDKFLGKYLVMFMVAMVLLGYLFPWNNNTHQTLLVVIFFGFISFSSAIGINFSTFVEQVKKPFLSLYMIVLVHLACPVVAWILGVIFYPGNFDVRAAFLISSCVPMASSCLVWTAMSGGNIGLTILTLSIEAFAAPVIIPLCLWLVLGKSVVLNYTNMILQLLFMVTIPSLIGMWVREHAGEEKVNNVTNYLNTASKVFMLALIYINCSASFQGFVADRGTIKLILVLFLYVSCNYIVGFIGMSVMKGRTWQERVAAIFCCGIRNNGFALIIAITYFNHAAGIPLALSVIVQQPFAGIISHFLIKQKTKKDALAESSG